MDEQLKGLEQLTTEEIDVGLIQQYLQQLLKELIVIQKQDSSRDFILGMTSACFSSESRNLAALVFTSFININNNFQRTQSEQKLFPNQNLVQTLSL